MIDRARVLQIIDLLKQSSSAELTVGEGDSYVRVQRGPALAPVPLPDTRSDDPLAAGGVPVGAPVPDDAVVRAKLVGRFYRGKGPGQPPLVTIGQRVDEGQIIATVESLGKLTGVSATEAGDVIEFLSEEGAAVQFGDALVRVRRE